MCGNSGSNPAFVDPRCGRAVQTCLPGAPRLSRVIGRRFRYSQPPPDRLTVDQTGKGGAGALRYWMLRLFLTAQSRPPLLALLGETEEPDRRSRQQFLESVFTQELQFRHHGSDFIWRHYSIVEGTFLVGVIARRTTTRLGGSPTEDFGVKDAENWITANVLIDISDHPDGQKVAMEHDGALGTPFPVFRALVDYVNARQDDDWIISVHPITLSTDFWSVVQKHRGQISQIELTFVPPNIFGGSSATETAMKELNKIDNMTEMEVKIKNPSKALTPQSERLREAVDYISKGGGEIQLKSGNEVLYSSETVVDTQSIPDETEVQQADPGVLRGIIKLLFGR